MNLEMFHLSFANIWILSHRTQHQNTDRAAKLMAKFTAKLLEIAKEFRSWKSVSISVDVESMWIIKCLSDVRFISIYITGDQLDKHIMAVMQLFEQNISKHMM